MRTQQCSACSHPMAEDINRWLIEGMKYKDIQGKIAEKDLPVLSAAVLSKHTKKHVVLSSTPLPLEWRDGQVCFVGGPPLDPVSTMAYLAGIVTLAGHNAAKSPWRVSIRDGLLAAELMVKLNTGVDKLDDFTKAWTEFLMGGKRRTRRTRRVIAEEVTESDDRPDLDARSPQPMRLPHPEAPIDVEYVDFPEDDDASDDHS